MRAQLRQPPPLVSSSRVCPWQVVPRRGLRHCSPLGSSRGDDERRALAVPVPVAAPAPTGARAAFSTDVAMDQLTEKGVAQGLRPTGQILASSFLGGAMLGWGGLLMTVVAGGCAGLDPGGVALLKGAVFPVGLSMITLSGSELFTGNMLTQTLPPIGEDRARPAARVLGWSFVGNFCGSLAIVSMVCKYSRPLPDQFLDASRNG